MSILSILFLVSPYAISNYAVFIFLAPFLYTAYSVDARKKIGARSIIIVTGVSAMLAFLPVILYNPFIYIIGVFIIAAFLFAFFTVSVFLIRKFNDTFPTVFIPCFVWTVMLYVFDFKSVLSAMFDVGVLIPVSAPVIWYTGSIGITALVILFNSATAKFIADKSRSSFILSGILAVVFIASFVFSTIKDPGYLHATGKPVKVALVQGAIPGRTFFGYKDNIDDRVRRYAALSATADDSVDIVIWPEYAFPTDIIARFPDKAKPLFDEVKRSGKTFIIGSIRNDPVRKGAYYDSALIIGPDGNIKETYYSCKPFVFNKHVIPGQFSARLYADNAGLAICWEEFSPEIFRAYVNSGAEYFITMLSDADLDHSWLKRYVTFFARSRAAESMRYLGRVTQTGITEVISPFGKVIKEIPADKAGVLRGDIYKVKAKTFYSAHGDILTKLFLTILAFTFLIYGVIIRKKAAHE